MPALVQSEATGLNRDKILNDTFWCVYCCCEGAGLGPVSDPALCAAEVKNLCVHGTCVTADLMAEDGLCGCVMIEGPMSSQCQCPPLAGAPKCLCCNIPLAGGNPSGKHPSGMFDYGNIFGDTWWSIYCICAGYGMSGVQAQSRPIFALSDKCLICRATAEVENNEWPGKGKGMAGWKQGTCIEGDDVACSGFGKTLCCFEQMQLPPAPNAPCIAICNKKIGGMTADKFGK